MRRKIFAGMVFGRLTVLDYVKGTRKVSVRCECGTEKLVEAVHLGAGRTRSCGCAMLQGIKLAAQTSAARYQAGQRFGMLTLVERVGGRAMWLLRCDCGGIIRRSMNDVNRQGVTSCGCTRPQFIVKRMAFVAEYNSWKHMHRRCYNPADCNYPRYGGRGISICERWRDFDSFLADIGTRPTPRHTLDRIDVNGNYEPGNCRWATQKQQQRNRRNNRIVVFAGTSMSAAEFTETIGASRGVVARALAKGLSPDEIAAHHAAASSTGSG